MVDESTIKPPVIVDARTELLFFRSPEAAGAYIEEIDVTNGEYGACWDSEGRPLALRIEPQEHSAFRLLGWPTESVVSVSSIRNPLRQGSCRKLSSCILATRLLAARP